MSILRDGPRAGPVRIVSCSPFDLLEVPNHYSGRVAIFPFPAPSVIPEAVAHLKAAFEIVAALNPACTGFIRHNREGRPELTYTRGTPFGDRLKVRDLGKNGEFCYSYEQMKDAGFPAQAWKRETFAMYGPGLAEGVRLGLEVPTMGVQVTFIDGGMVVCAQFHHTWTDLNGYVMNVERLLKDALDKVAQKAAPPTIIGKMGRWIEEAKSSASASLALARKNGPVEAIKQVVSPHRPSQFDNTEQDRRRYQILQEAEIHAAQNLPPWFTIEVLRARPGLNQTPLPLATPDPRVRPYRPTGYASAILVFPAPRIRDLKSRIQNLLSIDADRYLTPSQRQAGLDKKISSNTVLTALLWTHITEARSTRPNDALSGPSLDVEKISTFATIVDVRARFGLPANYLGNATFPARAALRIKNLISESADAYARNGPLINTAVLARAAVAIAASIDAVTKSVLQETVAWVSTLNPDQQEKLSLGWNLDYNNSTDLYVTSWSRLSCQGWGITGVGGNGDGEGHVERKLAAPPGSDGAMCVLPKRDDLMP